jgi:hypothetical protein
VVAVGIGQPALDVGEHRRVAGPVPDALIAVAVADDGRCAGGLEVAAGATPRLLLEPGIEPGGVARTGIAALPTATLDGQAVDCALAPGPSQRVQRHGRVPAVTCAVHRCGQGHAVDRGSGRHVPGDVELQQGPAYLCEIGGRPGEHARARAAAVVLVVRIPLTRIHSLIDGRVLDGLERDHGGGSHVPRQEEDRPDGDRPQGSRATLGLLNSHGALLLCRHSSRTIAVRRARVAVLAALAARWGFFAEEQERGQ